MDKIIVIVEFEKYHDQVKGLPLPEKVYGCGSEDDNGGGRECLLVYLEEAA